MVKKKEGVLRKNYMTKKEKEEEEEEEKEKAIVRSAPCGSDN